MYGSNLGLPHIHAEARRHDLLNEAERQRRVNQALTIESRPIVAITTLRRAIGTALVRVGERVQGVGAARATDRLPSAATLRIAR